MSKKTIMVCGYGVGISDAVARKFGKEGYAVALVARSKERLAKGEETLKAAGIEAKGFACDVGDESAVRALVGKVREALGPVAVVHWNAYAGAAGDLTTAPLAELRTVMDVGVFGMIAAVQAAMPDLEAQKGAVLVTGGGFGLDAMNGPSVQYNAMGLALTKAAQHKLAGLLAAKLAPKGVHVAEVMVTGMVKGTPFDQGNATLDANDIAAKFWELFQGRKESFVTI